MSDKKLENALPIGEILKSPKREYKIEKILGVGGFGITYMVSAEVMVDNIPVTTNFAIKEHYLSDCCERDKNSKVCVSRATSDKFADSLADFKAEANRLKSLSVKQEKGIVRVNEVFHANNTEYYVMEYLNGENLRAIVRRNGPLKEEDALNIMKKICLSVAKLHNERITHLDIKPDNIIMHKYKDEQDLIPVLIDFGLSKHYDSKGKPTSTIRTHGCSDGYSPIEQYVGIDNFAPTADIYSLGATFFYMLTGKDPIIATEVTPEILCSKLPANLSEVTIHTILCAMKKDKAYRTQKVVDFFNTKEIVSTDNNTMLISQKHHFGKRPSILSIVLSVTALIFGFFFIDILNIFKPAEENEILFSEEVTAEIDVADKTFTEAEEQITNQTPEDATLDQMSSKENMQKTFQDYIAKAEKCTKEAEKFSGNKKAIRLLLDAKYYYYDKAGSIYKELNEKRLEPNEEINTLVLKEFNYWVKQADKQGSDKKKYAMKKMYYERAYMLIENKTIKARIEWLNKKLNKK